MPSRGPPARRRRRRESRSVAGFEFESGPRDGGRRALGAPSVTASRPPSLSPLNAPRSHRDPDPVRRRQVRKPFRTGAPKRPATTPICLGTRHPPGGTGSDPGQGPELPCPMYRNDGRLSRSADRGGMPGHAPLPRPYGTTGRPGAATLPPPTGFTGTCSPAAAGPRRRLSAGRLSSRYLWTRGGPGRTTPRWRPC